MGSQEVNACSRCNERGWTNWPDLYLDAPDHPSIGQSVWQRRPSCRHSLAIASSSSSCQCLHKKMQTPFYSWDGVSLIALSLMAMARDVVRGVVVVLSGIPILPFTHLVLAVMHLAMPVLFHFIIHESGHLYPRHHWNHQSHSSN